MSAGMHLLFPGEPSELRVQLREAALEAAPGERSGGPRALGAWLWEHWQGALEPAGVDRDRFVEVVAAAHREVWLWLIGDRGWDQLLSGLAGRVGRRAGAPSPR